MPDNTSNTGYIPPHMRPRQPQDYYIPPHLRNTPRDAVPQAVQQMCESSQAPATTGNRGQTSRAFQATQDKWAHQNCVDREGGDTLNEGAQISENAAANEDMTVNGGVALDAGEGNQSSDQITAPITSAPTTPPLPNPTTPPAAQQVQQNTQEINAQIPPSNAPRAMGGHRGPRMQKSNFGKTKRNDKWVTNKEIRERAQKNTHEPVGAWGSDESETGFNSNPGEDPQHDIKKLVDWQGNWLPGPTDWEARRSYHHRNFNEEMMRFVYDSIDKEATVDVRNEPTFLENPSGEVAPRVWTSLHVEGTTLQEWWNNHVGSPLADSDNVAWWRAYTSQESDLLVPHDVPEAKLDPADHEGQILNLQDYGSGRASENLKERNKKKKADRARRQAIERQMAAAAVSLTPPAEFEPPSPPSIKPSIGLYIRPALAADAHQIAGIYNHYVTHSIRSPEIEPISVTQLSRRIADETTEGMPWLVACQKSKKFSRGITTGTDALILGFACASDYFSRHSAYGFTAEAEVYVHNNHLRKKVGSCLMDRLLYILDPFHYPQEGYQFFGTGPLSEQGGVRVIGSAIMNVPYDRKDRDDLEGITKFLGNFGFKKEAELTDIGVKQEKHVNLAMFRYHTGNTIDPRSAFVS